MFHPRIRHWNEISIGFSIIISPCSSPSPPSISERKNSDWLEFRPFVLEKTISLEFTTPRTHPFPLDHCDGINQGKRVIGNCINFTLTSQTKMVSFLSVYFLWWVSVSFGVIFSLIKIVLMIIYGF